MNIAAVAFDLDDTLAPSKSPISAQMAALLVDLAELVPVCIISGGRFEQFREQVLAFLPADGAGLASLHLMPTCGTRYYRHTGGAWTQVYAQDLTDDEKRRAVTEIRSAAQDLGLWEPDEAVAGERIEDRGSQVTYSALGQRAPVERKRAWDPDGSKRHALQRRVQAALPDLEVRAGGSTSVDITRRGIDKAYGIAQFATIVGVAPAEILFVGDRLEPGGNDHPVIALGVQTRAVAGFEETAPYVAALVASLRGRDRSTAGEGRVAGER